MMAVDGANEQLVTRCLNVSMNPFLQDALGQNAYSKTNQFTGELGNNLRMLVE